MQIISSNSLDELSEHLARHLNAVTLSIFEKEKVLIQSKAMSKWLQLKIAEKNHICAQVDFIFLKDYIIDYLTALGFEFNEELWSKETLVWRLFELLPEIESKHDVLKHYIQGQAQRRLQLSIQLASLYSEYMIYRPDWLEIWIQETWINGSEPQQHESWQAEIWRCLSSKSETSFSEALVQFLKSEVTPSELEVLPKRLAIFGVTNLPVLFLQFFEKLSYLYPENEIAFYYLTPCQEYWADLKEQQNLFQRQTHDHLPDFIDRGYQVQPYQLLKSYGVLGRDFLNLLIENTDFSGEECFVETKSSSTLSQIQNGILHLKAVKIQSNDKDDSIEIHACHSPMRELQVLLDYLKAKFKQDKSLKAHEVMVLCPDIAKYSPYVKAVFEEEFSKEGQYYPRIPYSISDQQLESSSLVLMSYVKILKLYNTRLCNHDLIDLLNVSEIRAAFDINEDDLELIHQWVKKSEIRWGKDAEYRKELLGIDGFDQNTWRVGLDRLLSGYAFGEEVIYEHSLSTSLGSGGVVLGKFKTFVDQIFYFIDLFKSTHSSHRWKEILLEVLDTMFVDDESVFSDKTMLSDAIQGLYESWTLSEVSMELDIELIVPGLKLFLKELSSSKGFLERGVTFCTLLPMRSIPAKVICLLGMNDGEFPRIERHSGFDLMQKNWRQGDRSVRIDDRYIFMESLLSAKERLYISYCGFDAKDNTSLQPSILVADFCEFLKEINPFFDVTEHPMHPFSVKYFNGELKSFSERNYQSALSLYSEHRPKPQLCVKELDKKEEETYRIDLRDLDLFFKNPAEAFLKHQLMASMKSLEMKELDKEEDFGAPGGLEAFDIKGEIFESLYPNRNSDVEEVLHRESERLRASGRFAYGFQGDKAIQELSTYIKEYCQRLWTLEADVEEDRLYFELEMKDLNVHLSCDIDRIFSKNYLPYRFSRSGFDYRLRTLIPYLAVLNYDASYQAKIMFKEDAYLVKPKLEDSRCFREDLKTLVEYYVLGMKKPLAFLPKSFAAYQSKIKGKNLEKELKTAKEAAKVSWVGAYTRGFSQADSEDESYKVVFGETFPGESALFAEEYWRCLKEVSELFSHYEWEKLK